MKRLLAEWKLLTLSTVLFCLCQGATAQQKKGFLEAFDSLGEVPTFIALTGESIKAPKGGHIQGIQIFENKIFLSASSSEIGYLAILVRDSLFEQVDFLGIKPISQKPLNHAGGIQITDQWLAVGCEDPKSKQRSIIALQDISSSQAIAKPPTHDFEREGKPKLSTAGAVGLLQRKDHFLLAVATWDALTIDFYRSNHSDPARPDFEFTKWTTWDARMAKRKGWVEKKTRPYQNIQLFEDATGLYMIATANAKTNVADVFLINPQADIFMMMKKVRSRAFELPEGVSFRNGAGMMFDGENAELWSVGRTLHRGTKFAVFR